MIGQLRDVSPRRLGPYVTLARLGAGGMGEVFLARPDGNDAFGPGDLVAVKAIRNELATDDVFRRRFRREAEVAARVDSPFVARLVASEAEGEVPWLATEYVAGPTLSEAVRRHGPLPMGAVAALGAGVARALTVVHEAGALHRDLKPGNVLLGQDGPKLIDFGVARVQDATTMTRSGLLVGTPGFMSPEHVAGGRHVVAASDVFCLASVLTYAVTGRDPFGDGPMAAVLYRVSRAEADLTSVPDELREILAACLARDPAGRPGAAEVAERLVRLRDAATNAEWPDAVRAAVDEARRDVEQLCASGQALLPVPRWPEPAAGQRPATAQGGPETVPGHPVTAPGNPAGAPGPPVGVGLHQLPTMSGSPPPTPARPRRRAPRVLLASLAVAVVAGALGGALAVWGPWSEESGGESPEAARPGGSAVPGKVDPGPTDPAAVEKLIARAGVDAEGTADRSGVVDQVAAQRPKGWKAWRGALSHSPMSCAADTRAIVCLLTNGTYEALSAVDGKRLWKSGKVDPEGGVDEAYIGPSGAYFRPGDVLEPQVRGGKAVIAHEGVLQVRDSTTGDVLWDAPAPDGAGAFTLRPLMDDDTLLVTAEDSYVNEGAIASLHAYDLDSGRPLWDEEIGTTLTAKVDINRYQMRALRDGVVYADEKDSLAAYDARTGEELGRSESGCGAVLVGEDVLCTTSTGGASESDASEGDGPSPRAKVLQLKPRTFKKAGEPLFYPGPEGYGPAAGPTAVSRALVVSVDPGKDSVQVNDRGNGRVLRSAKLPKGNVPASSPLMLGDRAVYADSGALYTLPLGAGTGKVTRHPVPGAPGDRPEPPPNVNGTVISEMLRAPTVLALGGVAHIVYDEGRISSVELP
ncbi:protein kinase domain-containing protein [Streptomyces sp. NRRL S-920]|uniref:serine/threonine-protein kinase n=1 Tax=Streptomyces sp. NRRL S-920 TaxID=1463921 RepID=UPI0004C8E80C|nr:serine/threonine-protein kinase [Streptomyces sp. NRRL S-920]